MRAMWAHSDTPIRVISRSICALLAKCLLQKPEGPSGEELRWLNAVTEISEREIYDSLGDPGALDYMILKSFVCGVFPHRGGDITNPAGDFPARPEGDTSNQVGDIPHPEVDTTDQAGDIPHQAGDIPHLAGNIPHQAGDCPTPLASSIAETLATLMHARTKHIFRERILELIGRMQVGVPHEEFVANKLSQMLETPAPEPTPPPAPELTPPPAPELMPSPAPNLTPAPAPATSPSPPAVAATVPLPAPASPANTLPVRSLFRTIFGACGRVHESSPERPSEPEP
jgi:hypothetical protein